MSYRQKDGTELTDEIMWRLRAGGVPVWRDADDLLPGDTETRLREALADGLAGGVLVITKDLANSRVVREIEAPALLRLAENTEFSLAIANSVMRGTEPDYGAPDRLLGGTDGSLAGFMQYAVPGLVGMRQMVEGVRKARMRNLRAVVSAAQGWIDVDVQTRNVGSSDDRSGAGLDLRLKPAGSGRLPDPEGLRFFADTAAGIPTAVQNAGARSVRFGGGAHLSVALALGALLPATRIGHMEVLDQHGTTWTAAAPDFSVGLGALQIVDAVTREHQGPRAVAVYLDLMPLRNDGAWQSFLRQRGDDLSASLHVRPAIDAMLDPADASELAAAAASLTRELSYRHDSAEVHLIYRGPFPLAVLIGRLMNTVRTVLYEWDDASGSPRYVPALQSTPADLTRPVTVLLPTT
ncbi:MAG: SAVED domain-containing protein [Cellulomonadaceae bacterium]|nr:SAVED domain-containing protein [Cellulomonadaceae bacterium]